MGNCASPNKDKKNREMRDLQEKIKDLLERLDALEKKRSSPSSINKGNISVSLVSKNFPITERIKHPLEVRLSALEDTLQKILSQLNERKA